MKKFYVLIVLLIAANSITGQNQNVFTYKVGDFEISLLSEGQQTGNSSVLIGATPELLERYTQNKTFPNAINAFLVRTPDKIVLVDAGLGRKLFDNLQVLGVSAEQINVILLTHMHGDHIGGLLRDGEVAFPNAEVYLPKPEYKYWTSNKEMKRMPENRRDGFTQARKVVAAYKKKRHLFRPGELNAKPVVLFHGFQAIAAYGHTPGHTAYLLSSNNQKLLIWGDLTHAIAVQIPHPEIAVTYDKNPEQATASRKKIVHYVADNNIPVAGMHIAYPGIGKIYDGFREGYAFQNCIDQKAVQKAIEKQMETYPESHLQDIYKNFFQDYFGPGHLIPDTTAAANYLQKELASYAVSSGTTAEPTGWQSNFYRVNLSVLKDNKIPYQTFIQAFIQSANNTTMPSSKEWFGTWKEIQAIIDGMQLNLPDYDNEKIAILELLLAGKYAMHHSEIYDQHYQPHYRLIEKTIFESQLKQYVE